MAEKVLLSFIIGYIFVYHFAACFFIDYKKDIKTATECFFHKSVTSC